MYYYMHPDNVHVEREGLVNGYANVRKGDRLTLQYISTKAMFTNYGLATYCTQNI